MLIIVIDINKSTKEFRLMPIVSDMILKFGRYGKFSICFRAIPYCKIAVAKFEYFIIFPLTNKIIYII